MRNDSLTLSDINEWVDNDEGLYRWRNDWCRHNKGGTRAFIKENRQELEECINRVLNGSKPAHYLAYGG